MNKYRLCLFAGLPLAAGGSRSNGRAPAGEVIISGSCSYLTSHICVSADWLLGFNWRATCNKVDRPCGNLLGTWKLHVRRWSICESVQCIPWALAPSCDCKMGLSPKEAAQQQPVHHCALCAGLL